MTIERERDIAVRALNQIVVDYKMADLGHWDAKNVAEQALAAIKREQALQALTDQAQELDMGYGAAQASSVTQDDDPAAWPNDPLFDAWWDADNLTQTNPYAADTPAFWSWEGWQACRASVAVPATPSGYAYRYPGPYGGLRFSKGEEINGDKPSEAVPYWFRASPAAQPVGEAVYFVKSLIHLNGWYECSAYDFDGHVKSGYVTRTLYTAPPVAQDQDAAPTISHRIRP